MKIQIFTFLLALVFSQAGSAQGKVQSLHKDSIYQLSSSFVDQNGKPLKLDSLKGTPVVISMAYTGCAYTCPLILSKMQEVEKAAIAEKKPVPRFVLISFDFQKDTPSKLKDYAKARKLSGNWTLLTSKSDKEPREVANVLGIKYKKMDNGDYDHSFIITVLNSEGVIQGQQVGASHDPREMLKLLN